MDLYAVADDGVYEIKGDTVTLRAALPASHIAMNETGGPFAAWFKGLLYVVMRLADGTVKIDRFDGSTFTEVHSAAGGFVDAAAGAAVVVAEGSIHVLTHQANNVIRRYSSSDGASWAATDHTGTFGATGLAMWNPTYFKGRICLLMGNGAGSAAEDFQNLIAVSLSGTGLTEVALTASAGTDHYGIGIHDGYLYIIGVRSDASGSASVQIWDGSHLQAITVASAAALQGDRPAVFEFDGAVWFASKAATPSSRLLFFRSADQGATWAAVTFAYLPSVSAQVHVSAVIDDSEVPGSRAVYVQMSAITGSPGLDLYRLSIQAPGIYVLDSRAASAAVDAGASLASFTRGYPHASIDSLTDNGDGTVSIVFTVRDADSEAVDVSVLYSRDRGGNYAVGTWQAGQVVTNLASSPAGTQYTRVWESGTDLPGGGEVPLVAILVTKN